MKRFQIMIIVISLLFVCVAFSQDILKSDMLKFAVFADPHLMAFSLNPFGEAFDAYMGADRKLLDVSSALLEKVVDELLESDVELVLVPGDLTKDGELVSHVEVAAQLKRLTDDERLCYVIPGNHDINNPHAVRFEDFDVSSVDTVSPEAFKEIYNHCGYNSAISQDEFSLSYMVEPAAWLRIIAMDSCVYADNMITGYPYTDGEFSEETLAWILKNIQEGREKGQIVIGMMHHSIIPHFNLQETYFNAYILDNWQKAANLFADNGMHLIFTGHFHTQDVAMYQSLNGNTLYDVQTGSLITYPNPYRIVEIDQWGEVEIKSYFIETLPGYDDFKTYSQSFVKDGISGLLPALLKEELTQMGFPRGIIYSIDQLLNRVFGSQSLSQHIVDVMTSFYAGDEQLSEETAQVIQELKRNLLNPFLILAGLALDSLSVDAPPADNDLLIVIE
ncbi:MAG: metallophosphoesterase [Thermotogota bacterium]|nr:metallophosphoesterase [Thermotogota bacterium]